MHDRRRPARFVALIAAALAVAGTTQSQPSPPPSQRIESSGTLHLSAGHPVVVQPLDVAVEAGDLRTIGFDARLGDLPTAGSVVASIQAVDPTADRANITNDPSRDHGGAAADFVAQCPQLPCAHRFVLILTWLDPPTSGSADVGWTLTTSATFNGTYGSSSQVGRVAVNASAKAETPAATIAKATSGTAVSLTEGDRFRLWTIELDRDASKAFVASQARLSLTTRQTRGEAFGAGDGKDRRETQRRDPPVQIRAVLPGGPLVGAWAADEPITFDPFPACRVLDTCQSVVTVELAWADGRPETAFDASWTLDLVSGSAEPIETTVRTVKPIAIATATASGAFETSGEVLRAQDTFRASAVSGIDVGSPWYEVVLPARAVVTAHATSVGPTPLPADAEILVSVGGGQLTSIAGPASTGAIGLRPGETGTFAWEPAVSCPAGPPGQCTLFGAISGSVISPTPNVTTRGMVLRVEWTLELGLPVLDNDLFHLDVNPLPSARP